MRCAYKRFDGISPAACAPGQRRSVRVSLTARIWLGVKQRVFSWDIVFHHLVTVTTKPSESYESSGEVRFCE